MFKLPYLISSIALIGYIIKIISKLPVLNFLGNNIQEQYFVRYRPYKIFLYDFATVSKIFKYDSYMVFKNPACTFVRSFNRHSKLIQQSQLKHLSALHNSWYISTIYDSYMFLIWSIHGSYMVLIRFIYGSYLLPTWSIQRFYMIHTWFLQDTWMVPAWLWYGSIFFQNSCLVHGSRMVFL